MGIKEDVREGLASLARLFSGEETICAACGRDLFADGYFCAECLRTLPFNDGATCAFCGRATAEEVPACIECKADAPLFDRAASAFRYEGEIVRLVRRFKTGERRLAKPFAFCMRKALEKLPPADFLVFVPMTKEAERRRGYNQARLLAQELSALTGIPTEETVLEKTRETSAQKELSARERMKNMRGCFHVHERKKCRGRSVLLVDDVLTTGATASAAAYALRNAGAAKVYVLTVASVAQKKGF